MSTQMTGTVRMATDEAAGVTVRVHLDDETLTLLAPNETEIGTWPLGEIGIASRPDGFHLRIEGEEVILTTDDDARFALALGISTPTTRLARMMAKLRDEAAANPADEGATIDLDELEGVQSMDILSPDRSRREGRLQNGLPYLGPLVLAAAVVAFLTSVLAMARGTAISFPGDVPAWPAMMISSFTLAVGGFAAFQTDGRGRVSIGIGVAAGLLVILLTAGRIVQTGLVGEALLGFTLAVVGAGVLLAIDTAARNGLD